MPTDNFDRADSLDLGASWDVMEGTALQVVGNRIRSQGATGTERFNTDLGSDDHYAEADIFLNTAGFNTAAVCCRVSSTNSGTYYFARMCPSCGNLAVGRRASFSTTEFATGGTITTTMPAGPFRLRLEVQGSDLRAYVDGVLTISTTDTNITTGTFAGIRASGAAGDSEIDNFDANALASDVPPPRWDYRSAVLRR
jgi:hypothetical protein